MTVDHQRSEREKTFEEVVETAAMKAMNSKTGRATLGIDASKWNGQLDTNEQFVLNQQIRPILPDGVRSKKPHRELASAIEVVLARNPYYAANLIVETKEIYGPNPDFPEYCTSSLEAIVLHRRDKWNKPGWMPEDAIQPTIFGYHSTEKDEIGFN